VGKGAGAGAAVSVITSGTNSPLTIDAAGSGTITLAGTSTGNVIVGSKLATFTMPSAAGITGAGTGTNGILITNPKNTTNATVSGTPVTVQVTIGATPYYFLVYPTSTT
jgi:hypothetical protein